MLSVPAKLIVLSPSTVNDISLSKFFVSILSFVVSEKTIGLATIECEQIGVNITHFTFGATIGPPAEKE